MIEEAELEDLDQFEARLTMAYALSGEPPSRAAIEYIEESVALPERGPVDYADSTRQFASASIRRCARPPAPRTSAVGETCETAGVDRRKESCPRVGRAGARVSAVRGAEPVCGVCRRGASRTSAAS